MDEIKKRLSIIEGTPYLFKCDVTKNDFKWLVITLNKLISENEKLHKEIKSREESHIKLYKNYKLVLDGLKYYAEEKRYRHENHEELGVLASEIEFDEGLMARSILNSLK